MDEQNTFDSAARTEEMENRLAKLKKIKAAGRDPFGRRFARTHQHREIVDHFDALEGQQVTIAGRLMTMRGHGKACFANLSDRSGEIQIYAKIDALGEESYRWFTELDLGDLVGVTGTVFRTQRGQITVMVEEWELLAKALRPLPEKWHGLRDVDTRYRQRYLDLIVNQEVRETFIKRTRIISTVRRFLDARGFLEVETPVLSLIAGGGHARPFNTHHNALDLELTLRIALELYHKRLIVGGLERVYEIGKCFRNEGISTKHNPEFTMIELYQAYGDLTDMMDLVEQLFSYVAREVLGTTKLTYQGTAIDLTPPWSRLSMVDAIKKETGIDWLKEATDDETAIAIAKKLGLNVKDLKTKGQVLDEVFDEFVEPKLIQPTFIVDYPIEVS
ncbi:MAG: lysine--tRNA ligase, partial [Firmicutes bacterium]|nr:lysine--tRNA ligase [Bacillota bacterium]